MSAPRRLGLYGVALLAAFGASFGVGRAVGPIDASDPAETVEQVDAHDHGSGPMQPCPTYGSNNSTSRE